MHIFSPTLKQHCVKFQKDQPKTVRGVVAHKVPTPYAF